MLCAMRGYEGSMSGWNGSHGSADSSRGLCVFRKMEIGAYVVNSNQASGHNSYYQGENDSDVVFAHHEPRHQGYPDSVRHELRASKMYGSQHLDKEPQKRQVDRSVLRERHQPDYGSTSNHQLTTAEKYSGSHLQLPNTGENYWISTQEMETSRSTDGCVAGNIYQGPIVRVQVPEVYYEGGSTRGTETAVAYRHNISYNKDHEQMGQHLQRARETDEIYGNPVSETYRRINEWLKNCQQHSSTSIKSSSVSHGSNHSRTENKPKQNTASGNFSKPDYRMHNQTGNISNVKLKPSEPRFVAPLESKAAKAGNVMLQPNQQHRHRNTDWTEKHEVPFRHENQSSAPRNNDVTSAFSSGFNHVVNTTKPFYESGPSKTSSEWSSETLSIIGSDKSSYCTDFTPFELDSKDVGGIHHMDSASTSAGECPPNVGVNVLISHVTIDDKMQRKNVAHTKEFSEAVHDSFGNEFAGKRRNEKSNFNSRWNANFGQKFKQQRLQDRSTDKIPKNPTDLETSLPTSKTGRVVTVFIGDGQKTQQGNPQFDNITKQSIGAQNNVRYQKATADPASSAEDVQNSKISDRRVLKGDRKSVQVPSETKLYTSDRKPMIPLRCTSIEQPLSSRYTDHRFSIPADNSGYKESSNEEDSALHKQLNSRPVPQLRSGSLSITIRPNRLSVIDYFKNIDDVWDSAGRKEEPDLKGTVELPIDIDKPLLQIGNDTAPDAKALDINDVIDGLKSGSGDNVSEESEELDEFTKTVIKADISGKAVQSSSHAEFPLKPQYNVLKQGRNLKPNTSTLLADVHSRFAGKVYQTLDDKKTESEDEKNRDLKEQVMFEGDIPLKSIPSFHASQGQPQDCHSSIDWLPGKSADSLRDRDLRMKFTKNDGLVDDSFGHNSEYMKHKYEDILDTDFRSRSEKKHSEMYLLRSKSVSKNSSPEFQSFIKNHSDSHNFISGDIIRPNGSADQMAPVSDELYTDDRSHMETASPRSLRPASEVVSDALYNHLELESVQCSKAKATANKSNEEDSFLMSLLQSRTPDLPTLEGFCTPRLQSRNLVRTSDFTVLSSCGGDSEHMPFKSFTDQFDKEAASRSVMKSPKTFEGKHLQDEEPSSLDFKLLNCRIYESPKEGGKDYSEEFYQQKSEEAECSRKLLKDSPDSLLSVVVEGAATPAAIPRCHSQKSDSMTHEEDSERQGNNGDCSKISENYAGASFIINNTMKNSEPMYCQEVIDFPENLVIDPPESFSDFTIML